MKNIKKNLFILLFLCIFTAFPLMAKVDFDPTVDGEGNIYKTTSNLGADSPLGISYGIINWALSFVGFAALVLTLIGGFMWMLAMGEEEKINKAKDILRGAVIGLVLVLASLGISQFIFEKIGDATTATGTTASEASE